MCTLWTGAGTIEAYDINAIAKLVFYKCEMFFSRGFSKQTYAVNINTAISIMIVWDDIQKNLDMTAHPSVVAASTTQ